MHLRTKIAEIANLITSEEDLTGFKTTVPFEKKLNELITIVKTNQKEKPHLVRMRSKLSSLKDSSDSEIKEFICGLSAEDFQRFQKANGFKPSKAKDPKKTLANQTIKAVKDLRKNNQ